MPAETNVNGIRDADVRPGEGGAGLAAMLAGGVRALVCVGDNPVMHVPDSDRVRERPVQGLVLALKGGDLGEEGRSVLRVELAAHAALD